MVETGAYLKGLWVRLNGGGTVLRSPMLNPDLPLPASTRKDSELVGGGVLCALCVCVCWGGGCVCVCVMYDVSAA